MLGVFWLGETLCFGGVHGGISDDTCIVVFDGWEPGCFEFSVLEAANEDGGT
jgi:hypothetical protein